MIIEEAIIKLSKRENLSDEIIRKSFIEIIEGKASDVQISAFLMGLSVKGETEEEITETVRLFREYAVKINAPEGTIDVVGTGGDRSGTFNISTATAFVLAGAGAPVAKHGNRSASSLCGSIDVLEQIGIKVDMKPETAEKCLWECGITVLFAPLYHPAMKRVVPIRKELKIRTIFNILGPMLNPAQVKRLLLGIFSKDYMEVIAKVLLRLGVEDVIVIHSEEGLDEASISGKTYIARAKNGKIDLLTITPEDAGLKRASIEEIKGADKIENAKIILEILKGSEGPKTDIVLLNSALALMVAGKASDLKEGVEIAKESIKSGRAYEKFETLKKLSNAL
ncbi:anthranilate phosphoribosyltransferase [Thermodesulfovibrio hydrogeniphilus]